MTTLGTTREESATMAAIQSINDKIPELTLRDLFAMSALTGLLVSKNVSGFEPYFAEASFKIADAMIEARSKQ